MMKEPVEINNYLPDYIRQKDNINTRYAVLEISSDSLALTDQDVFNVDNVIKQIYGNAQNIPFIIDVRLKSALGKTHFVSLVIQKTNGEDSYSGFYRDSCALKGWHLKCFNKLKSEFKDRDITIEYFVNEHNSAVFRQQKENDCLEWALANTYYILTKNRLADDSAETMDFYNTLVGFIYHHVMEEEEDNEKQEAVKLLNEVVTLGKSQMVKYLADHAHSKDIEYIRSIEPIKDAYRVFLDKGFGYTKIFLRGIKENFTFDSLSVARDFDELVHIDTIFRKKTSQELLASSEWKNLGNDTTDYLINIDEKKAEDQRILPIENEYNSLEGVPDQDPTGLIGHLEG